MPDPKPHRTWRQRLRPRLSLRALIAVVLVLGWLFSIVHRIDRQARVQREAVAAIRAAGGDVWYDFAIAECFEFRYARMAMRRTVWAPRWVVEAIGVDYFAGVESVSFIGTTVDADEIAREVGRLEQLDHLTFLNTNLGDVGLSRLSGLNLRYLHLGLSPKVTGEGLKAIRGMANLENLDLCGTSIGDPDMALITSFPKLEWLWLNSTRVTDAGMEQIGKLGELRLLALTGTRIGDPTVARLKSLAHLDSIGLSETRATPRAIAELRSALPGASIDASPPNAP